VFSYYRMCSLTIECVLVQAFNITKADIAASVRARGLDDEAAKLYSRDLPSLLPGGASAEDAFLLDSISSSDSSAPEVIGAGRGEHVCAREGTGGQEEREVGGG
jgi:hypothetical protein